MSNLSFTAPARLILLFTLLLPFIPCSILTPQVQAQGIVFNGITPNQTTVAKWDMYEAVISLTGSYTNPYDYNDITVQATFTAPSGAQRTVDAFWMHDYSIDPVTRDLAPTADSSFRVRFTPDEPGQWSYVLSGRLQGGTPTTSSTYFFTCSGTSATGKGYIRKTNSNYLKWDNGAQYIPVGENIPFPTTNIILQEYDYYLNKLGPTGVNFIRVWMANWGFGLEWTNGQGLIGFNGLKQYKQSAAKALDYVLQQGHINDYATMVCIYYHNQILRADNQWYYNPYSIYKGGPCTNPEEFFTNATAKDVFKNQLRYLVARWGYSGSLQSWELFNEADNWPAYDSNSNVMNVDLWHHEMAGYLHSIDPNHLVTASFGAETNGNGTWNSSNIDFTQTHKYKPDPRLPRLLSNLNQQRVTTYSKPTINGEFGLSYNGSVEPSDPYGITLHNVLWATLCSGGMGSAAPWYWNDWIDPQNLYPHFSPLTAFKDAVPLQTGNYKPVKATYSNTGPAEATILPEAQWGDTTVGVDFTLDNEGILTPGVDSLQIFIHGSAHPELRKSPTFRVNYLQNGSFVLVTDTVQSTARINIYVDGVLQLDQPAQVRTAYSVNISAGPHTIRVDNSGGDWAMVVKYQFLNAVGPLNMYILKSADNSQAAGYMLQRLYNYQYCLDNSNVAPPVVSTGALISVPGMNNGTYTINFYSCAPTATTAPAQPVSTLTAAATNGALTFNLPEVAWDIAFTATNNNNPPGAITSTVSVTPQVGWGAATSPSFTISSAGVITPGSSELGTLIYGSQANTQYRNPPAFIVNYAQAGYFEVRTAATTSSGWPRVTIYVDGVKMLDQPAFVNTSYVVTLLPGLHSIMVDNLGGDWVQVDHYSFVPSLASPPPAPPATSSARTVTPGYPWGSKPPFNSFTLSANGTLTPDASNLGTYVYGSQAHPDFRNPATFNVTFLQDGYFKVTTGSSVSQDGASRVSIYVDGVLVTDQRAFTNLSYVVAVTTGTHSITVDNLGLDWFLANTFVFDVLSP